MPLFRGDWIGYNFEGMFLWREEGSWFEPLFEGYWIDGSFEDMFLLKKEGFWFDPLFRGDWVTFFVWRERLSLIC